MTRTVGRYVPVEMAVFWLLELLLSFAFIYLMLSAPPLFGRGGVGLAGLGSELSSANHAALLAVTIGGCAVAIGLYRPEICFDRRRLVLNAALAAVVAFPAALAVNHQFSLGLGRAYPIWLTKVLLIWLGFAVVSRWLFSLAVGRNLLARRVLLVGSGERTAQMAALLHSGQTGLFQLASVSPSLGAFGRAASDVLHRLGVWGVVVAGDTVNGSGAANIAERDLLLDWKLRGLQVYDDASFCEQHLGRVNLDCIDAVWFLRADGFANTRLSRAIKRLVDIVASLVLLGLTFPLMLATAILIKLDSPGPALYRQQRVGLYRKNFTLLKFRSMRVDAEAAGQPRWAAKRDTRVTRVGAFIRQTRIDELPQLLNVLCGNMSLVGPRPERPHFVEQLAQVIPFYNERSYVKPGVTGWAQVNFPYGASVEDAREKLSYDLYYLKHRSVVLDLLILILTVRVILFREGAR